MELSSGNKAKRKSRKKVGVSDSNGSGPQQASQPTDRSEPGGIQSLGTAEGRTDPGGNYTASTFSGLYEQQRLLEVEIAQKVKELQQAGSKAFMRCLEEENPELFIGIPDDALVDWSSFESWFAANPPAWISRCHIVNHHPQPVDTDRPGELPGGENYGRTGSAHCYTFVFDNVARVETMVLWWDTNIHFLVYEPSERQRVIDGIRFAKETPAQRLLNDAS